MMPRPVCAAFVALLALVAGCSNNPYPAGETASNTIYTIQQGDLKTLDPTVSYNIPEGVIIDNIYLSYFRYHHLKQSPYVLELSLGAEEPKRVAVSVTVADEKTHKPVVRQGEEWTFRIKKGLRFQDDPCFPGGKGREIIAADFLYSFRRMAQPRLACPVLSFFQDKIVGMDELVGHAISQSKDKRPDDWATYPVAGLIADPADPYTFRIRLSQPYPQLRYLMAMHFTTPIPHEAADFYKEEYARHPVGCGSFVMSEYLPKQRTVLVKNPNRMPDFYPAEGDKGDREAGLLEDAGKPLPLADKIVYNYQKESLPIWNLFQQGYLDSAGVSTENFSRVLSSPGQLSPEMKEKGVVLKDVASPSTWYYSFNMRDPLWGGYGDRARKLRQAVSLCIDREQNISVMLQGQGQVAESAIPPGIYGYEAGYKNPFSRTDVEKAKQLLAEAGCPDGIDAQTGKRVELNYDAIEAGAPERQAALLVKQQIEKCGIQVNVQTWQTTTWEERVHKGKTQFFRYSWFADYPDPENFLFLFYGPNIGGVNYANYDRPEYNHLFEQMRGMSDGPARLAIIRQMREMLTTDCPWVYSYHTQGYGLSYNWLHNNKPHGVANDGLRYVRVDGAKRAAAQLAWNKPNYLPLFAVACLLVLGSFPAAATVKARRNRSVRRNRPDSEGVAS